MIRIRDGEICNVYINETDWMNLNLLIYQEKLQDCLFGLYDSDVFLGYATHNSILLNKDDIRKSIFTEQIIIDEYVFDKCNEFFNKDFINTFIPLYDREGNIQYFAYRDTHRPVHDMQLITFVKNLLVCSYIDIRECYEGIECFDLYECNELSFYLYKYLRKKNIPYILSGIGWDVLLDDDIESHGVFQHQFSSEQIMRIGGKSKHIIDDYLGLYSFLHRTYKEAISNAFRTVDGVGSYAHIVNVPFTLDNLTEREKYRRDHSVNLNAIEHLTTEEDVAALTEVYGKELIEKYKKRETFKDRVTGYANGVSSFSVLEEEREKNIYLIGPCITYQSDLMVDDTILGIIQKKVNEIIDDTYKVTTISVPVEQYQTIESVVRSLKIGKDDLFIFIGQGLTALDNKWTDLTEVYMQRNGEDWFSNEPIHVNQIGSYHVAEYIWNRIVAPRVSDRKNSVVRYPDYLDMSERKGCQTAHYRRRKLHFDFSASAFPTVQSCR